VEPVQESREPQRLYAPSRSSLRPDGADLGREDAIYWQIALRIPVVGPDVEIVFLAPVYARPA